DEVTYTTRQQEQGGPSQHGPAVSKRHASCKGLKQCGKFSRSMGVQAPRRGRWSVPLGDLAQIDLVERGADHLRLVGLGVAAFLQLAHQIFKPLDVLVVERDADDLVVRRLLFLLRRRRRGT